jgi:ribonucleoside-diphosphate reductase alpha chain
VLELQETSNDVWRQKYQLKDHQGNELDKTPEDTFKRVANALAGVELDKAYWSERFLWVMQNGAIPAGRILSNAGATEYKPATSLINCTVSSIITDSMEGILTANLEAGLTLAAGCGIGYEFSTLRPRGSYVNGAGATTSGAISFMDIFNAMCFTVSSAGGRRGAQMGTLAIWHPDVEEFIKAKREDGRLRQFNLSVLIDQDFLDAIENDSDYQLVFPIKETEFAKGIHSEAILTWKELMWEEDYCKSQNYIIEDGSRILCRVYKTVKAKSLFDTIMRSTYDYAEPGFILIDNVNKMNNNWFCEKIRATNPCKLCTLAV